MSMLGGPSCAFRKWMNAPKEVEMPGGESLPQLQARAFKAFSEIAERHQGGNLVLSGTISAMSPSSANCWNLT
jgi:broad specificity phosphatase PhoE